MKYLTIFTIYILLGTSLLAQEVKYKGQMYDLSLNKLNIEQSVLVKEKFPVSVKVVCLSSIQEKDLDSIHMQLGNAYYIKIRESIVKSTVRSVFGKYSLEEIISIKRGLIENELAIKISKEFSKYFIQFNNLIIESILPSVEIQKALEARQLAIQENIRIDYLKEKRKKELELQKMEAIAEAERNKILDESLTEKVLQEKYIQALIKLAESENSKVVIFSDKKIDLNDLFTNEK